MRRLVEAAAILLVALGGAGCGSLGAGEETEPVQEPQFLSGRDIARHPEGSPARTVLEWWRALQFDNPVLAHGYYASDVKLTRRELARQLGFGPGLLNLADRPKVWDVTESGDRATVFVLMTKVARNPNGRTDDSRVARSFNLVREDGEWKLADNRYLARHARTAEAFFRGGEQGQREERRQDRSDPKPQG